MVKVDINQNEIQALDIACGKVEVKPMVGHVLVNFRIKIRDAILAEQKEKQQGEKKGNGKKRNRKTDSSNKK